MQNSRWKMSREGMRWSTRYGKGGGEVEGLQGMGREEERWRGKRHGRGGVGWRGTVLQDIAEEEIRWKRSRKGNSVARKGAGGEVEELIIGEGDVTGRLAKTHLHKPSIQRLAGL